MSFVIDCSLQRSHCLLVVVWWVVQVDRIINTCLDYQRNVNAAGRNMFSVSLVLRWIFVLAGKYTSQAWNQPKPVFEHKKPKLKTIFLPAWVLVQESHFLEKVISNSINGDFSVCSSDTRRFHFYTNWQLNY